MSNEFFEHPIRNSPYEYPKEHWELDESGQPTQNIIGSRRPCQLITPIPKPKKRKGKRQKEIVFDEGKGLSTEEQQYDPTPIINGVRREVDRWRAQPNPSTWGVTPETARLLQHWRHHKFSSFRPFFCQVEAAETAIWLTEVAYSSGKTGRSFLDHLKAANGQANPELLRLALKMATGAGKTTVMAMIIAWQTINAVRHPNSKKFTRGFLVTAPGITIRDRLRVLQPNDPDSYYGSRELVPNDMLIDIDRAKIVITNYPRLQAARKLSLSKAIRAAPRARGPELQTLETEGQMLQRVMPDLMGMKNILALNDEAHHCYREKPETTKGTSRATTSKEAEKNNEAARLWISGIEASIASWACRRSTTYRPRLSSCAVPVMRGHALPLDDERLLAHGCDRVRHRQAAASPRRRQHPRRRHAQVPQSVGAHRQEDAQEGRGKAPSPLDPLSLPAELQTALDALYGHYEKTFELWQEANIGYRRSSSSSATTRPPPSSCTTTSPVSIVRAKMAKVNSSSQGACPSSATTTNTATPWPSPHACLSTASSWSRATRWTRTSGIWPTTKSSASAVRSSSARESGGRPEHL
jgi:type III restriction enzyme